MALVFSSAVSVIASKLFHSFRYSQPTTAIPTPLCICLRQFSCPSCICFSVLFHFPCHSHTHFSVLFVTPLLLLSLSSPDHSAVPNLFGTRDRFRGRQFFYRPVAGGGRAGAVVQAVMRAMGSGGWSFACSLLTSCCEAQFLTGPVAVRGSGVGDPCFKTSSSMPSSAS